MASLELTINGQQMTVAPQDYIHSLMRFTSPQFRKKHLNSSPSYPDVESDYINSYGKVNHPLSLHGDPSRYGERQRGGWEVSGAGTNTLKYVFTEPLFIAPLLVGGEFEGMTNINQLNVAVRWGDLKRMFSCLIV